MTLPPPPDAHAIAVLFLVVLALFLFTRERIPMESSSLCVLAVLAVVCLFLLAWLGADWATRFQCIVMALIAAAFCVLLSGLRAVRDCPQW